MRLPDQNTLMPKPGGLEWIQNFACLWHHLIYQMKKKFQILVSCIAPSAPSWSWFWHKNDQLPFFHRGEEYPITSCPYPIYTYLKCAPPPLLSFIVLSLPSSSVFCLHFRIKALQVNGDLSHFIAYGSDIYGSDSVWIR